MALRSRERRQNKGSTNSGDSSILANHKAVAMRSKDGAPAIVPRLGSKSTAYRDSDKYGWLGNVLEQFRYKDYKEKLNEEI